VHPKRDDFVAPMFDLMTWDPKTYPQNDSQSQMAPGGTLNQQALDAWGMKVN
jgi:hypothetical protein